MQREGAQEAGHPRHPRPGRNICLLCVWAGVGEQARLQRRQPRLCTCAPQPWAPLPALPQKLAALVTEAMKDAHGKSVEVRCAALCMLCAVLCDAVACHAVLCVWSVGWGCTGWSARLQMARCTAQTRRRQNRASQAPVLQALRMAAKDESTSDVLPVLPSPPAAQGMKARMAQLASSLGLPTPPRP